MEVFLPTDTPGCIEEIKAKDFAVLLEERCCLPGHKKEAKFVEKGNYLFVLTVEKRKKNMHTHTHSEAQTSEKFPAEPIPQAGYQLLWLSNMPHTFTSRSLPLYAAKALCAQITLPPSADG